MGLDIESEIGPVAMAYSAMLPVGDAGATGANDSAIRDPRKAKEFINQRHPEYEYYVQTTRWILDTLEAAEVYKDAEYGVDARGVPIRNLYRQSREYPYRESLRRAEVAGGNPFTSTLDDEEIHIDVSEEEFETRRQRTPTPNYLSSLIEKMLSKIFKRPVKREGPTDLTKWADNIDGRQTTIGEWMQDSIMPLLLALGMIDVVFRRPVRPADEPVMFDDGQAHLPSRQCVANYALPEDVLWWRLDYTGKYYVEVNIRERHYVDGNEMELICHWNSLDWTLYDLDGKIVAEGIHGFGVTPVVRLFDRRRYRMDHTANSRMLPVCDLSRAYYNEESELISNQTVQNCPLLEGPALPQGSDNQTVPIGANYMLRRERAVLTGEDTSHKYIAPPMGPVEFTRSRLQDLVERMEASVCMTVPGSGVAKAGKTVVAQSGLAKSYDQNEGSEYLASVARVGQVAEYTIHYFAWIVIRGSFAAAAAAIDQIEVMYPKEFNLLSFDQYAAIVATQSEYINSGLGMIPDDEKATLKQLARMKHPDMGPAELKKIDGQIDTLVDDAVKSRKAPPPPTPPALPSVPGANGIGGFGALQSPKPPPRPVSAQPNNEVTL